MIYIFAAAFGLMFGSFLNVCIYRLPRKLSIVSPGSRCPDCGRALSWHENIPVLSFIILKGRCGSCKKRISLVYPAVEIITALIAVMLLMNFGATFKSLSFFVLFSALIVASFIDFQRHEIPDIITLPGIAIGLALAFFYPGLLSKALPLDAVKNSLLGIIAGGGSLYALGVIGGMIFKKEAMGGGDIKLLAMIGSFLGWKAALLTFFIAPFFGSIVGVILKIKDGREIIPYGPYLAMAAFVALLWGDRLINALFHI